MDRVWRATPVSGGKLCYRNRGSWLVLSKTSPATYMYMRSNAMLGAAPEIMHLDKLLHLMHYPADFEEG